MKKAYSKPDVFFEDFTMSTNIAAGCEFKPNNQTDNCGVRWGRFMIFTAEMSGCTRQIQENDATFDKLCYHVPSMTVNVFFS